MPLMFHNGKPLIRDGKLAMSAACCCDVYPPEECESCCSITSQGEFDSEGRLVIEYVDGIPLGEDPINDVQGFLRVKVVIEITGTEGPKPFSRIICDGDTLKTSIYLKWNRVWWNGTTITEPVFEFYQLMIGPSFIAEIPTWTDKWGQGLAPSLAAGSVALYAETEEITTEDLLDWYLLEDDFNLTFTDIFTNPLESFATIQMGWCYSYSGDGFPVNVGARLDPAITFSPCFNEFCVDWDPVCDCCWIPSYLGNGPAIFPMNRTPDVSGSVEMFGIAGGGERLLTFIISEGKTCMQDPGEDGGQETEPITIQSKWIGPPPVDGQLNVTYTGNGWFCTDDAAPCPPDDPQVCQQVCELSSTRDALFNTMVCGKEMKGVCCTDEETGVVTPPDLQSINITATLATTCVERIVTGDPATTNDLGTVIEPGIGTGCNDFTDCCDECELCCENDVVFNIISDPDVNGQQSFTVPMSAVSACLLTGETAATIVYLDQFGAPAETDIVVTATTRCFADGTVVLTVHAVWTDDEDVDHEYDLECTGNLNEENCTDITCGSVGFPQISAGFLPL